MHHIHLLYLYKYIGFSFFQYFLEHIITSFVSKSKSLQGIKYILMRVYDTIIHFLFTT